MNRRTAQKFLIYKGVQDERELKENIEIVTNSKRLIFSIFRIFPKIGFLILNQNIYAPDVDFYFALQTLSDDFFEIASSSNSLKVNMTI